ncbi:MAG: ABC transporter substrate-binding protein [Betaproteobacteria bacterium]|nr:ABC transporter substrate-binding protein [Betaproteobacteria bacterium]
MDTFNADSDPATSSHGSGITGWCLAVLVALTASGAALAADTLKLAIGERGDWENAAPVLGQKAGFFKKHGLTLKLQATRGGGETLRAVITGKSDLGLGVGTAGVLGAFAIGAPVRAIASSTTGADDVFWYVPAGSTIKSIKEADGKTIAYSSKGSSTSLTVLAFNREFGIQAKPVATGGAASTFRQTMAGQVDIGWSAPPFGVAALQQGRIRIVGRQGDLPAYRDQTIRLMIATPALMEQRRAVVDRFLSAYRETLDWMYADPAALKAYAKWAGVSEAVAKALRDQFYPKDNLRLDRLSGLDAAMADAVSLRYLPAPLTREQQDELFKHYVRGGK